MRLLRDHQGYLSRLRCYINHPYLEENWRGKGLMKPMLEAAYELLSKGVTVVTLLVLHRDWLGSSAWYKLGYEDWTDERRLEFKLRAK